MATGSLLPLASQSPRDLVAPQAGVDKLTDAQAARMFEGLVMAKMFQTMRETVHPSGLFGEGSQARSTYEYLLDQAVVEHAMASGKGLGLAESMEKMLKR